MLRLEWVEEELERVKAGTCTMQTVRDYALLCIASDSLRGDGKSRPPVSDDANLDAPSLDQVERALGEIITHSDAEQKRKRDALTWARIIKGDG